VRRSKGWVGLLKGFGWRSPALLGLSRRLCWLALVLALFQVSTSVSLVNFLVDSRYLSLNLFSSFSKRFKRLRARVAGFLAQIFTSRFLFIRLLRLLRFLQLFIILGEHLLPLIRVRRWCRFWWRWTPDWTLLTTTSPNFNFDFLVSLTALLLETSYLYGVLELLLNHVFRCSPRNSWHPQLRRHRPCWERCHALTDPHYSWLKS